jgi:hypothetical protein
MPIASGSATVGAQVRVQVWIPRRVGNSLFMLGVGILIGFRFVKSSSLKRRNEDRNGEIFSDRGGFRGVIPTEKFPAAIRPAALSAMTEIECCYLFLTE